jgi:hypothetical protein
MFYPGSHEAPRLRRELLRLAAGAALLLGAGLAAGRASAGAKTPQKQVQYQPTPKGSQRCQTCTQFLPAPGCKLVEDPISPNGWCALYAAKS